MKFPVGRLSSEVETVQSWLVVGLVEYNTFSKFGGQGEVAYWTEIGKGGFRFWFLSRANVENVTCTRLCNRNQQFSPKSKWNVKWKAEEFILNTERFVDLNSKKFKSVKGWMEKFDLLVKLVVLFYTRLATTKSAGQ